MVVRRRELQSQRERDGRVKAESLTRDDVERLDEPEINSTIHVGRT